MSLCINVSFLGICVSFIQAKRLPTFLIYCAWVEEEFYFQFLHRSFQPSVEDQCLCSFLRSCLACNTRDISYFKGAAYMSCNIRDICYFLRSCLACNIRDWHRSRCRIFKLSTPVQQAWSSWATISEASLG